MGTTFVTMSDDASVNDHGFWMSDAMLELWLRLLALHLPEPTGDGEHQASLTIRNKWLLASRGYFMGCIPHGMNGLSATEAGRAVVRLAIASLLDTLQTSENPLDADTLNLLGIAGTFTKPIERQWLREIGWAFLDLLDGKITDTAASADIMPGSFPYQRRCATKG